MRQSGFQECAKLELEEQYLGINSQLGLKMLIVLKVSAHVNEAIEAKQYMFQNMLKDT